MRTAIVIGLIATTLAAKEGVRLKPKWKANERVSVKMLEVTHIDRNGREIKLATRRIEYVQTTTSVKRGIPVRAKRKFDVYELLLAMHDTPEKNKLVGRELEFVSRDGVLYTEKAPALMTMGAGGDWTWMLPDKPVVVGSTWVVKRGLHLFQTGAPFFVADTKCRLASIDSDTARIEFTQPDTLKGSAEFSLKRGRVLKASFKYRTKDSSGASTRTFTYALSILPQGK